MPRSRFAPLVSVITATYNRAAFLPDALRSVRQQSLRDWEHIIIDDGSTDDTPQLMGEAASDPRIVYRRTANRGQPAALNLGLETARAPLVAFLDSDDEYKPDHLALLTRTLREDDLDFVLASFELIVCNEDPDPRVTDFYHPDRSISVREIECITGVLFGKKAAFDALGGFREMKFADTDLLERMKAAGYRWTRLTRPTYRYYFGRAADSLAIEQSRRDRGQDRSS